MQYMPVGLVILKRWETTGKSFLGQANVISFKLPTQIIPQYSSWKLEEPPDTLFSALIRGCVGIVV